MYIEDIINTTANIFPSPIKGTELKILLSLYDQIIIGNYLTEKQGNLAVSILRKYKNSISVRINKNIDQFLDNPIFKNPFRTINHGKTIKIVDHEKYNKAICVEFPYDDEILSIFRQKKQEIKFASWNKDDKCWFFGLEEQSIKFLIELINKYNFKPDEEFQNYINQINDIEKNLENLVPMAIFDDEKIKIINVSENCPKNTSSDFVEGLFFAKSLGITVWDQKILEKIETLDLNTTAKKLLQQDSGKQFEINLENTPLDDLGPIIKYISPLMVILGSNKPLEKLIKNVEFFNSIGIKNEEMTVMFRLPSDTDLEFNNYVKNMNLNSKLSKNIKVVFVGDQIPKPIFIENLRFNGILNYNYFSVHYKIKNFLSWHHNVINILDRGPQRSINFANM